MGTTGFESDIEQFARITPPRRIRGCRGGAVWLVLAGLAAVLCCASAAPALAVEEQATCPANAEPYTATPAVRQACGVRLLPQRSTTSLPYGGTQYNYEEPNGRTVSLTVPPASFDAATASPHELEVYGVPPEPSPSSPEYPKWKAMIEKGIDFAPAPARLAQAPHPMPGASPLGTNGPLTSAPEEPAHQGATGSQNITATSGNWSGYFNYGGHGGYTHATAYIYEPSNHGNSCGNNVASSTWGGIGGTPYNPNLAQAGTDQGTHGLGENAAWFEVLPEAEKASVPPIHATSGAWFEADTQYKGNGEFSFYFYNFKTHATARGIEYGGFEGRVAEFILERKAPYDLTNVGTVPFQGFTNGTAFGADPTERIVMENHETHKVMAAPSGISSKYAFSAKYENYCLGQKSEGEGQGPEEGPLPSVTTNPATAVSETTATLNGAVSPEGFETTYDFEYGTEPGNFSASTPEQSAGKGSSKVSVSGPITGLRPGTTYYYRIIANSPTGTAAGTETSFKTSGTPPPPPPTVTTEGASGIMAHTATVGATVNPNGADTHYYFEYGTVSTLYESDAPALPGNDAGSGTTPVKVNVGVGGLAPYTTYYYRVVASNSTGTSYGTEQKFTTLATGTFSAGAYHTCALVSSGGSIDCWGYNYDGELGNGTTKNISTKPVAVSGITTATEVSAGGYHTCALLSGSVHCWGYNKFGELGNGTTKGSSTPVAVSGITNAIEVSGGDFYTCSLLSGGSIDCWGENGFGELGDGTFTERTTPVAVHGITNATEVTAGALSTCALLSSGSIDCWGYNGFGELGTGSTEPEYSPTPVAVKGITNAVAVSAVGDFYTCALLSGGTVKCWGDNEDGELGNGTTVNSTTPVQVSGITNAAGVVAGAFHTCAWLTAATAYCWGENYFGELGNGTTVNSSTPVQVSGITSAAGVTAGTSHTCARLIGGSVDCWGENLDGQLGNGTTTNSSTPVAVSGLP
jgi:alpha-tubulin suppressor-like RCC1 family protein